MAVAHLPTNLRSYSAVYSRAWLVAAAKSLIQIGVSAAPGAALRLAAYVQSLDRAPLQTTNPARPNAPAKPIATFEELLANSDAAIDQMAVLRLLKSSGQLSEAALHRYLTTTFAARRLDLLEHALETDDLGHPDIRHYHALRLQQYRGEIVASPGDVSAAYHLFIANKLLRDNAANLCTDLLARTGDVTALATFLEGLPTGDLTRLSPPTFFGMMRLLASSGMATRLDWLRQAYLRSMPLEQQLYFLELLPARDQRKLAGGPVTWRQALIRFSSLYSANDADDRANFERCVFAPFKAIPSSDRDFLNIRFDAAQRMRLHGHITAALKDGRSLSLVRLGDGEAYGYDDADIGLAPAQAFRNDNDTRERMWWGRDVPETTRAIIRHRFREAVGGADIIGIPSIYRLIRDRGPAGSAFGRTGGQRGLAVVLAKLGSDIPVTDRILTEERCHQILFNRETIESLCAQSQRVVLVSCWTIGQVGIKTNVPVHEVVIPGHTKVAKVTGMADGAMPLFETFETQLHAMEQQCAAGTLVFVGAGFLGKILIAAARAKGAVALDVGAVLDYMAGYKTRSLADLG